MPEAVAVLTSVPTTASAGVTTWVAGAVIDRAEERPNGWSSGQETVGTCGSETARSRAWPVTGRS